MDPPEIPTAGVNSSTGTRREVQLHGPRPTPLRVSKDSHKIQKPPPAPKPPLHSQPLAQPLTRPSDSDDRQTVIIYAVSPKIVHADASNFMSIVQRLTGFDSASTSNDVAAGPVSPAARLASIERTSPSEKSKDREKNSGVGEAMGMVEMNGVDLGQIPGVLSPAPANLPVISPGMFSPAQGMHSPFGIHDMISPFMYGSTFLPSPSGLFCVSPTLSPAAVDLLHNIFDL
ncbi:hypothetical protein Nepgr_025821 [Nepenthes gracilis]|uniref:VQ domain-containing protein n=1 Tax=Nepenthes gracilis TaxID=150966 RepID=A0AAD3T6Z6_NEPGR|nr:hypothetical protein Nepgr_025821 [Nepenthes gracilis]